MIHDWPQFSDFKKKLKVEVIEKFIKKAKEIHANAIVDFKTNFYRGTAKNLTPCEST